jgi:hypothetical protein
VVFWVVTLYCGGLLPTFQRTILPPSSGLKYMLQCKRYRQGMKRDRGKVGCSVSKWKTWEESAQIKGLVKGKRKVVVV